MQNATQRRRTPQNLRDPIARQASRSEKQVSNDNVPFFMRCVAPSETDSVVDNNAYSDYTDLLGHINQDTAFYRLLAVSRRLPDVRVFVWQPYQGYNASSSP